MESGMKLILGATGAGKSSFMFAKAITEMFNKARYRECKAITGELVYGGYVNLTMPPKHISYTEYFVQSRLCGCPKYVTYKCNAKRFGLPNNEVKMDFYPPCAVISLDEIQDKFENRNWKNLKEYYRHGWEINRHMKYLIYLVSQFGNVDKDMRNIVTGVYYIENKWQDWSKDKYAHLQSFWKYKYFDNWLLFERWYNDNSCKTYSKEDIFCYDGDIKRSYDGEAYRAEWLKGRERSNYSQVINKPTPHTVEGYNEFLNDLEVASD